MRNELENALGPRGLRGLQAAGWMVAISFVLIRAGKDLFIPLVIALIGVYLIKILERWIGYAKISGRGLPPPAALALAFMAVIAMAFVLFLIVAENATKVAEFAPRYQSRFLAIQADLFLAIGFEQPPAIREFLGGFDIPGTVTLVATNLATLLKNAVLILIFGVFLLLESRFIPAKIAVLASLGEGHPHADGGNSRTSKPEMRKRSENLMKQINPAVLTFLRGTSVLLCVLAVGCRPQAPAARDVVRPVKTMIVSVGGDTTVRTFPGKVEASKQVELTFQVPGLLVSLPVREGQKVAQNDVIAQLRQEDFQARLAALSGQLDRARADLQASRAGVRPEERQRLEAQVRSAEASLVNARAEFGRARQLLNSRTISRVEFDRSETTYRVAQENFEAARQTLDQSAVGREEDILAREAEVRGLEGRVVEANLQLADSMLRAPYDGVIAQRFVEQGQNVRAKQPVVKFQDIAEIDIAADIPESVMADIRSADIVGLVAEFSALPGQRFPVHIKEVAQRADPVTQTFAIRVAMLVPDEMNLLPGMSATVAMTYRRASILGGRILVPIAAIFEAGPGQQAAWVLGSNQTVARRTVKPGEATGGRIEIVEGLQPGDRIAVAGVTFLREGMKVRDLGDALGGSQP